MPKPYPPEFRRRALDLVRAGRTIAQVAGDLQISESVLYSWRRQELIDSGQRPGVPTVQAAELVAAKRRIRELEAENEILRRASVALREAVPPKAKFGLVADLAVHGFEIKQACRVLGVSAAGFYEWRHRAPSLRAIRHAWLTDMITEVHGQSRGVYGAHRVRAELLHGRGILVGHNAVARLMQQAGLAGLPNRRARHQPPRIATATDLVDRRFARAGPDQLGVTDITEHRTREGKVYCCVVLDAYSRRVVGWSIDSAATSALATNALGMAIANRGPSAGGIIHSDHGVQFTSWAFTDRAKRCGLLPSMGSVGDAYDNAVIESFWGRMQTELLDRHRWRTRTELANAIFDYLEVFHNRRRRHSALGMLTPIEFELQHSAGLAPSVLA
jgi:transposase InsO family protein/transposase-like protein